MGVFEHIQFARKQDDILLPEAIDLDKIVTGYTLGRPNRLSVYGAILILKNKEYMTKEESEAMWAIEKNSAYFDGFTKSMRKLYKTVDKVITEGIITYEDFTSDSIDELTTITVQEGKGEIDVKDRSSMVDLMCERLIEKYEAKHKERQSLAGTEELQGDNTELSEELGLCEPECASEESTGDSTQIG